MGLFMFTANASPAYVHGKLTVLLVLHNMWFLRHHGAPHAADVLSAPNAPPLLLYEKVFGFDLVLEHQAFWQPFR